MLEVLRSGQLSLGPLLPRFEQAFAARVGADFASAVSSGTAGLHLALRAVGVTDGAEVVTSPFSFVASANVAVYERARPVFADIDPGHAQPGPGGRGVGRVPIARPRCSRCTCSVIRPTSPGFERLGHPDRRGRLRGAGRGLRGRRHDRGPGAIRRCSGSTPTSSSPPARAGW